MDSGLISRRPNGHGGFNPHIRYQILWYNIRMTKIFKYPIEPSESVQTIDLPAHAEIVAMRVMTVIEERLVNPDTAPIEKLVKKPFLREKLFFWAIVDPKQQKMVPRRLMCVGTGWEILPNITDHVDTCVTKEGFVWHLLEVK